MAEEKQEEQVTKSACWVPYEPFDQCNDGHLLLSPEEMVQVAGALVLLETRKHLDLKPNVQIGDDHTEVHLNDGKVIHLGWHRAPEEDAQADYYFQIETRV